MSEKPKYEWKWGELGFWKDVRHLGSIALGAITTHELSTHGDHFRQHIEDIKVETETHQGQLFEGDSLDYSGEPTQPIRLEDIRANLDQDDLYLGQNPVPYTHPFDHKPDSDNR